MELNTSDFSYHLPAGRIALFPSEKREDAKLLVYNRKAIQHRTFKDIVNIIPKDSLLVFNNSKVVPARLKFVKEGGATIEVFVLGPAKAGESYQSFFNSPNSVLCECTIGNKKRWPMGIQLKKTHRDLELRAKLVDSRSSSVELSWNNQAVWSEILDIFGEVPLPPYIMREATSADSDRYQTVYSEVPGAVAAPTAGLHFTGDIIQSLEKKGVAVEYLTLHVGAGTFMPLKSESIKDHNMHQERVEFSIENIENLLSNYENIISVGTTSCRSLESLYWFGVKLIRREHFKFEIKQDYPYQNFHKLPGRREALMAIREFMINQGIGRIQGDTSIFIYPSYQFRMTDALITNFHQPNSTLILLIAALIGEDWKVVYNEAMKTGYRFLSYGDSSFLARA